MTDNHTKELLDAYTQGMQTELRNIGLRVESIGKEVSTINRDQASIQSTINQWQINTDRFYTKDMVPLLKTVSDNQRAIADIQVELATLKTKIAIWGGFGSILVGIAVNLLMRTFS